MTDGDRYQYHGPQVLIQAIGLESWKAFPDLFVQEAVIATVPILGWRGVPLKGLYSYTMMCTTI